MSTKALCFAFLMALTVISGCCNRSNEYSAKVMMEDGHWVYTISLGDKLVIKQMTMPGMNSLIYFPDRETAMKTALLVRHRLNRGLNPSISANEMDSILKIGQQR